MPTVDDSRLDDGETTLIRYARREIDAVVASGHVCAAVAKRGGSSVRCVLVAILGGECDQEEEEEKTTADASTNAPTILAGVAATEDVAPIEGAVRRAGTGRLLITRSADHPRGDWIVVEPMTSRSGMHLGSLVVIGAPDTEDYLREDLLSALPTASRLLSDIALELLCRAHIGQRLHRFNNVLNVVSVNIEYIENALASENANSLQNAGGSEQSSSATDREELLGFARHAHQSTKKLLVDAAALVEALPIGLTARGK